MNWYVLTEDHEPVLEPNTLKAAAFFEDIRNRRVARHAVGEATVSTVFLGLDHNFTGKGPALLFETLVQGGPLDQHRERYPTWSEAVAGHISLLRVLAEPLGQPFTEVAVPLSDWPTVYDRLLEDDGEA